jgi:hypothetical protein
VQQIAHAEVELLEVERLLRRGHFLDLGQQVCDRAEDRFGRRRLVEPRRSTSFSSSIVAKPVSVSARVRDIVGKLTLTAA